MVRICAHHPRWAGNFFGGFIADIMMTLPIQDPWAHLSARVGSVTVGNRPPETEGAVHADGRPFGTWRDALDRLPLMFNDPEDDPQLVALTVDLLPPAAAILASGAYGWQECIRMIEAVGRRQPPAGTEMPAQWRVRWSGGQLFTSCVEASRWAIHRRRSYRGLEDLWPAEAAFRWAWRADRITADIAWSTEDVDSGIEAEKLAWGQPIASGMTGASSVMYRPGKVLKSGAPAHISCDRSHAPIVAEPLT